MPANVALAEYAARLANKRPATRKELAKYRPISRGRTEIKIGDRFIRLDREDENDQLDPSERSLASAVNPLWDDAANEPLKDAACPPVVDHRPKQTPIKDQKDRGTCVCFASLAGLEAILKRKGQTKDLSEQYANWMYMLQEGRNQCDDGMRTTLAARYLSQFGVCLEAHYKYEDRAKVNTHCDAAPALAVKKKAKYGISKHVLIDRLGLLGPSIANPEYLEALICKDYDIVFGTHVAWGNADANGVLDVVLDQYGNPLPSQGGHAMLIVGYDRSGPVPYFIVKNSWGKTVEHAGYYYLSYDYIRTYAKYGYIVEEMSSNMSAIPSDLS